MKGRSINRRTFVGAMCALGGLSVAGASLGVQPEAAVAAESAFPKPKTGRPVEAKVDPKTGEVTVNDDVMIRNITCVGCYQSCGNRIKLERETGRMIGVGGNPYHPQCAYPPLPFDAPLLDEYRSMSYANGAGNVLRGTVCGRGNGTFDAINQPTRITGQARRGQVEAHQLGRPHQRGHRGR